MYKKVCQGSLSRNISILLFQKWYKKVPQNGENAYLVMKYPRASGALRQAPDPKLKRAHFACMMLLFTIGNLVLSRSGPPLIKSWIRPCHEYRKQFIHFESYLISPPLAAMLLLSTNNKGGLENFIVCTLFFENQVFFRK